MIKTRIDDDDSESDDQGQGSMHTPLTPVKSALKIDPVDSDSTLLTSPTSSRRTSSSIIVNSSIAFNDNHRVIEIDCDYTDEQVDELWFTKDEYDEFLKACDEDAQKCEAHEKEERVAKLKKEIRKQRRQRRKDEKHGHDIESNSVDLEMDDDMECSERIIDADDFDARNDPNKDEEGWMCSYGLEAWTLEGYKTREHHRQKAIDAVLNEQYAAWDRGMVENTEMMSALYFAASATSKHSAAKKARELEEDVQEYLLVSTLDDYNKAVQTLNTLQKSLHCIKGKNSKKKNRKVGTSKAKRRESNESTASTIIDHSPSNTPLQSPQSPRKKMNRDALASKRDSSNKKSTPNKKKIKQRKSANPLKVYKSKAETNILVAPPTPPVTRTRKIVYDAKTNASGGVSVNIIVAPPTPPMPKRRSVVPPPTPPSSKSRSSSKSRKIVYKPVMGTTKGDSSIRSAKSTKSSKSSRSHKECKSPSSTKKKKKREESKSPSKSKPPRPSSSKMMKSPKSGKSRVKITKVGPSESSVSSTSKMSCSTSSSSSHQKKKEWWFQNQKQACH